jgi:hypothetical protein
MAGMEAKVLGNLEPADQAGLQSWSGLLTADRALRCKYGGLATVHEVINE